MLISSPSEPFAAKYASASAKLSNVRITRPSTSETMWFIQTPRPHTRQHTTPLIGGWHGWYVLWKGYQPRQRGHWHGWHVLALIPPTSSRVCGPAWRL